MGRFVADPALLMRNGNKILQSAEEFGMDIEKIYSLKNALFARGFVAPEAKAISNQIDTYRDELNAMQRIITDYGRFLKTAATKVTNTQNAIIDEIQ